MQASIRDRNKKIDANRKRRRRRRIIKIRLIKTFGTLLIAVLIFCVSHFVYEHFNVSQLHSSMGNIQGEKDASYENGEKSPQDTRKVVVIDERSLSQYIKIRLTITLALALRLGIMIVNKIARSWLKLCRIALP